MESNYVRNAEGIWVNSNAFRETGNHFKKYGYYCADPKGSPSWFDYWQEERRRCIEGFSVGGAKIPGDYYSYLNFCPITKSERTSGRTGSKISGFPDFWDGDYNYFWAREIARHGILRALNIEEGREKEILEKEPEEREKILVKLLNSLGLTFKMVPSIKRNGVRVDNLLGGRHLIVGKSRRKGFSFKNASIPVTTFYHRPDKHTLLMAYSKKFLYPDGIFTKCMSYINFINENTAWTAPSDYVRRQDHIRNSYKSYRNGIEVEKGYMSEIEAVSFKDNPQAKVGGDYYDIIGEEVGTWGVPGGLKQTLSAVQPSVTDGDITTGMITLFGTSNDIDKGTVDFASMFEKPMANGFLPFEDIWGDIDDKTEGFFFPAQLNMVGHYDENGNSNLESAEQAEDLARERLKAGGATSTQINNRKREFPKNSAEAFSATSSNDFPVVELKRRLDIVIAKEIVGTPVKLEYKEGKVVARPILDRSVEPISSYRDIPENISGCPVIYEYPIENSPPGLYKIGYDPIRQSKGSSFAAIIVYKGVHTQTSTHSKIVAEYIGRYDDPDDIDRVAELFADLYGTQIMHENETTGTKNYFRRIKRLNLLAAQPDAVISKNIKKSRVARVYGCHVVGPLKDAGERYIKSWLLMVLDYDEHGNPITVIDKIESRRLLEELIAYYRDGNFDLISALIMCMFQVQEEQLGKEYDSEKRSKNYEKLLQMRKKMYVKNGSLL